MVASSDSNLAMSSKRLVQPRTEKAVLLFPTHAAIDFSLITDDRKKQRPDLERPVRGWGGAVSLSATAGLGAMAPPRAAEGLHSRVEVQTRTGSRTRLRFSASQTAPVCFCCRETSPPPSPPPSWYAAQSHPFDTPPCTKACIIYGCVDVLNLSARRAPTKRVIDNRRLRRLFTFAASRGIWWHEGARMSGSPRNFLPL